MAPEVTFEQNIYSILSSSSSLKLISEFQLSSLILSMSGTCLPISCLPGSLEDAPDSKSQSYAKSSSDFIFFVIFEADFRISAL